MCGASDNIVNVDIVVPNQTRYLGLIGNIAEQIAKQLELAFPAIVTRWPITSIWR